MQEIAWSATQFLLVSAWLMPQFWQNKVVHTVSYESCEAVEELCDLGSALRVVTG